MEPTMLIGEEWRHGGTRSTIDVLDKFDGVVIASIPEATTDDVDNAVTAAAEAFKNNPLTPHQRYTILSESARLMQVHKEELARLLVREVGKTIREAHAEVGSAVAALISAAEEAKRIDGETVPLDANPGSEKRFAVVMHTPSGPVCAITPFNAPLNQAAHKVASAIAAGSSIVLKPSEQTPLTAFRLAEIMQEAGLPAGHLNLVYGRGQPVGQRLLEDKRFARFTFTGSVAVGRHILATVGIRPVTLELGSNAPTIVFADADIDAAAVAVRGSAYAIAGQVCTSVQRLYVHADILEKFTKVFVEKVEQLKLGNPMEDDTDVGPMLTDAAAKKAERVLADAVDAGARILTGGQRNGRLFTPTVVTDVSTEMDLVCREIFSPIVSIIPFVDTEAVIEAANDSEFGLQAGVFTANVATAFEMARRLRYGGVMINDASRYRAPNQPYGGLKDSGMGREGPKYAVREITDFKTIVFNLA